MTCWAEGYSVATLWAKSGGWLDQSKQTWRLWHSSDCQCFLTVTEAGSAASLAYVGLASCIVMGLQNIEPTTSMLHSGCLVKHRAPTLQASRCHFGACSPGQESCHKSLCVGFEIGDHHPLL